MGNRRLFLRGLFVVGLVAALCTCGLAAQQSENQNQNQNQNQGAATQQNQNQTAPSAGAQPGAQTPTSPSAPSLQAMTLVRSSDLVGKELKSTQGDNLGVIHDLVLTSDYQQVSYAALSSGGVFGINSRLYAIPWQALKVDSRGNVTTSLTRDQLKQSPGFTNTSWPSQPDMRLIGASAGAPGSSTPGSSTPRSSIPGSSTPGASASSSAPAGSAPGSSASASAAQPGQSPSAAAGQDVQMFRVSRLIGTEVKNPQDQDLGDIEDLAINATDGHVVYDIIAFGGVAGVGEKFAAVPSNAIRIQPQTHVALLNATRSTLDSVAFNPADWSKLSSPDYMQRLSKVFPAAPAGSALGYVPPQTPQTQFIADERAWGAEGAHARSFNPANVKTIQGTVQSVGTFKPEGATAGFAGGLRLRVKTSDGNLVTVYAGPTSSAEKNNFFVKSGDQITITGSESKIGPRTVIVASELKKGSQTLQLRDKSGKPLWTMGGASSPAGQPGARPGSSQRPGATGQNPPSNRTQPPQ